MLTTCDEFRPDVKSLIKSFLKKNEWMNELNQIRMIGGWHHSPMMLLRELKIDS